MLAVEKCGSPRNWRKTIAATAAKPHCRRNFADPRLPKWQLSAAFAESQKGFL
jgi:hypothetical protein